MPTTLFTSGIIADLFGLTVRLVRWDILLFSWDHTIRFIENSGNPESGSRLIECNMDQADLVARLTYALATPDARTKGRFLVKLPACHERIVQFTGHPERIACREQTNTYPHMTLSMPAEVVTAMLNKLNSSRVRERAA